MIKNNINKVQTMFLKNSDISRQVGRAKILRATTYTGIAAMAIYALCFICPPVQDNDSHAITGTSIASDTTLSISLTSGELPLDITPTSASGTFASTVDGDTHATIRVATNNITGYTLGIKASNPVSSSADKLISNNEKCENTPTSNKCAISSLSQPVSSEDYINNTVEGIDLNNTWGYAPSKYNSTPNTTTTTTLDPNTNENITTTSPINYYPAPVNGDTIATTDTPNQENTTANDGTLQEDEYTIDYGIRIDYTPYTGTYSTNYNNQSYIITAVGNPVPYSVSYNANKPEQAPSEVTVDNLPNAQVGTVSSGDTVAVLLSQKVPTIGTTNPSTGDYEYAGYVFNGWCTIQPQEDQTTGYQTCPVGQQQPDQARLFQPGDNFGIDQTVDNTQTLYATWGAPAIVTYNSNGLIYNNTPGDTINTVDYIPTYEGNKITGQRQNIVYAGTYNTPAYEETTPATNYILKGWSEDSTATEATYKDEQEIIESLNLTADNNITLYAIWTYTTVITFDGNGADSGTMEQFTMEAGKTEALLQNVFTKTNYYFAGWNTEADGSGDLYKNQSDYTAVVRSNDVTLYAQWTDCAPNYICYNDNGANSPIIMSDQTTNYKGKFETDDIVSYMDVQLWPMNYKYDTNNDGYNDYGFAGWSEDKNAASKILDTNPNNNPTIYGPNQTITLGDMSAAGLKLYAVWMPIAKDSTNADLTFQTTNLLTTTLADGTTLVSKPNGYVTALKDQRDNQVYAVAKLADGNYWMIENLRLGSSATVGNNINDPSITNQSLAEGYGGAFVGLADAETVNFSNKTTANSLYNTDIITGDNLSYRFPRYYNIDTVSSVTNMTLNGRYDYVNYNIYSFGNYYTWAAAIADTTDYTSRGGHTDIATSICPAGWHLPYGGYGTSGTDLGNTSGGFYYLNNKINGGVNATDASSSKAWRSFPNNFIYSGDRGDSMTTDRGISGSYWSSSAQYSGGASGLSINSGNAYPGNSVYYKYYGRPVRCVALTQ